MNLEGKIERSGTFTMRDLDSGASLVLMGVETEPSPVQSGEVRIFLLDPMPRPSPWHHPIRWLRWNPLMQRRSTLVLPNCEVREVGDGTLSFSALPADQPGVPPWTFTYEAEETK